jgi:hypothetical protein
LVDASLRKSLRWALFVGGVLGLLCAITMLLVTLVQFGKSTAALSIADRLPAWAQWSAAPPAEITMLIVGALCALLLVAGNWPIRICAAVVAAWFAYAQAAFAPGSHLSQQMAQTFDMTPFYIAGLVGVTALLAVSALAIVIAARPTRAAEAPHGVAAASRS